MYSYVGAAFSNHVHSGAGVYGRVLAHAVRCGRTQAWAGSEGGWRAGGEEQGVTTRAEGHEQRGLRAGNQAEPIQLVWRSSSLGLG